LILTNLISKIFGKVANREFSPAIQNFINRQYIKAFDIDMSEFRDFSSYKSLNELFTREMVKNRDFSQDKIDLISPCDSFVTECGDLDFLDALQIKGMSYNIKEFLTDRISYLDKLENGAFFNLYLSPKDYHRYHAPCDLKIKKAIHVTGKLYPVNFRYLRKKLNLFIENERVVLECETMEGKAIYMVLVGALNVGQMVVSFEPKIRTNTIADGVFEYSYENLELKKGECFGNFEMGSTIIMFFEKDLVELEDLKEKKIKFTDKIASFK